MKRLSDFTWNWPYNLYHKSSSVLSLRYDKLTYMAAIRWAATAHICSRSMCLTMLAFATTSWRRQKARSNGLYIIDLCILNFSNLCSVPQLGIIRMASRTLSIQPTPPRIFKIYQKNMLPTTPSLGPHSILWNHVLYGYNSQYWILSSSSIWHCLY